MFKKLLKYIVLVLYLLLIVLGIFCARNMTVDDFINYTPENMYLAALFLMFLYALKSLSVFFPSVILQIASGFLFHPAIALLLNTLGALISFTIPYFIGKLTGAQAAEKKIQKSTKLMNLFRKQHEHEFFLTFFLRVISCLPCDLVSMYLGALNFNFPKFLLASYLGTLPGIIPATFMGTSITDPTSPEFITALVITVSSALLSSVIYYFHSRGKHNDSKTSV